MIVYDLTRQPLHCSNKKALEHFNKGLTEYVLVREDCSQHFQNALKLDNTLVIPHSMMVSK